MNKTVAYFSDLAAARSSQNSEPISAELAVFLFGIDHYELAQSERLYEAFAVLGPILQLQENGNAPDEFDDYWRSVAKMRAKITDDLAELRAEALRRSESDETNIVLAYPDYPAFAWEQAQ